MSSNIRKFSLNTYILETDTNTHKDYPDVILKNQLSYKSS